MAEEKVALRVHVEGAFHSFRIPEQMTYHSSFYYPPRTTIVGMLGAAIGKNRLELGQLYEKVEVGVVLDRMPGIARDLWRIVKPKKGLPAEASVVLRDMIYAPRYWLYFSTPEGQEKTLEEFKEGFKDPHFALTLGKSDELVLVKPTPEPISLKKAEEWATYRWTVLPFDYRELRKNGGCRLEDKLLQQFYLPQVFKLPQAFETEMEFKKGRNRKDLVFFTHVYDIGIRVKERGWCDGERCFFFF